MLIVSECEISSEGARCSISSKRTTLFCDQQMEKRTEDKMAEVVSNDQQYRIARTIPNQTRVDRYYLVDECHWSLVQGASLVCTVIWKVQSPTPYILQLYHLVRNLGCSRTPHAKVLSLREGTTAMNMGKRCISTSNDRRR
jgi:hypothetical protein